MSRYISISGLIRPWRSVSCTCGSRTIDTFTPCALAAALAASSEAARGCVSAPTVGWSSFAGWPATVLAMPVPEVTTSGRSEPASAPASASMTRRSSSQFCTKREKSWLKARWITPSARSTPARRLQAPSRVPCSKPRVRRDVRDNDVVGVHGETVKHIRHPVLGPLAFEYSSFAVDGRPDLSLVVYNPTTPGDAQRIGALV